jgi:integrase/recombinase XerD
MKKSSQTNLLRQRMIEDMNMRKFTEGTQNDYLRSIDRLTRFLNHSPETATTEEIRQFQLYLTEQGFSRYSINTMFSSLRFFFRMTAGRGELMLPFKNVYQPSKVPTILSKKEVNRLIIGAPNLKYKTAFSTAYGAGLRVSEIVNLT